MPDPRNARTHPKRQVEQIAASIREFGFANPILVAAEGTIIAGHGRLLAAKALGMTEVPTIVLPHLSEAQQRALDPGYVDVALERWAAMTGREPRLAEKAAR
jgi:ParB-like chromosome segregation protein Spo0J